MQNTAGQSDWYVNQVIEGDFVEPFMNLFNAAPPPTDFTADEVYVFVNDKDGQDVDVVVLMEDGCAANAIPVTHGLVEMILSRIGPSV